MKSFAHYIILFFIITLAVCSGNLLSNYITAKVAEIALEQAAAKLGVALEQQQEVSRKKVAAHQQEPRVKRSQSAIGRKLSRACVDWLNMEEKTSTPTTRRESKVQCDKYERYVETGIY